MHQHWAYSKLRVDDERRVVVDGKEPSDKNLLAVVKVVILRSQVELSWSDVDRVKPLEPCEVCLLCDSTIAFRAVIVHDYRHEKGTQDCKPNPVLVVIMHTMPSVFLAL